MLEQHRASPGRERLRGGERLVGVQYGRCRVSKEVPRRDGCWLVVDRDLEIDDRRDARWDGAPTSRKHRAFSDALTGSKVVPRNAVVLGNASREPPVNDQLVVVP